jgi:hypothetical protein
MIYIIILTWNGIKYLPKLFESLAVLNYPKNDYKILVLDSGSTDGSVEFLEKLEVEGKIEFVKLAKNFGFAGGNNIAMEMALKKGAKFVTLLNQDSFVEPDFLAELVKTAEKNPKAWVIQPLILHYKDPKKIQTWGNDLHYLGYGWSGGNWTELKNAPLEKIAEARKIPYASGAGVLYKTEMLEKIGLFDENYFSYHEDSDICFRAKFSGHDVVLSPKSIVYHDYNFPTDKNKLRYFWNEKNRLYLILKFYHLKTLFLILPMMIFMDAGQLIFAFKNGYIFEWLKARLWFIFNANKLLKARKNAQKNRKISDKELTKDFSSEIKYQSVKNPLLDKIGNPVMKWYWWMVRKII